MNKKLDFFFSLFIVQVSCDFGSCKYFGGVCEGEETAKGQRDKSNSSTRGKRAVVSVPQMGTC